MKITTFELSRDKNVNLTCYVQETGKVYGHLEKRPSILIIPGGGYNHLSPREAEPAAFGYLKAGWQAFILHYTCNAKWPVPLEDYEKAMQILKDHEEEFFIDPEKTAVIGFSAGGHLALAGSVLTAYKPKVLMLAYSLTGEEVEKYAPGYPSLLPHVNEKTPACFMFATANDASVSVLNTIHLAEKLSKNHVPFECHVYPYGRHGYSTGENAVQKNKDPLDPRIRRWLRDSIAFANCIFEPENRPSAF